MKAPRHGYVKGYVKERRIKCLVARARLVAAGILCAFAFMFAGCDLIESIIGLPVLDGGDADNRSGRNAQNGAAKTLDTDDFYLLCARGKAKQIQKAIKKGASVNAVDGEGFSPLFYAAVGTPALYRDAVAKMKEALKNDKDDAFYEQKEAAPCTLGNIDAVRTLLNNGANVRLADRDKNTAFLYAALFCTDVNVLKAMVSSGADTAETITVTYPNSLLSISASLNTSPECVKYLAEAGNNINDKNKFGTTPIMWAAMYQTNPDVIDALIECGAAINDKSHKDGYTPLYWARRCNRNAQVIERVRHLGGKMLGPQHTIVDNTKFPKLHSDKVFAGAVKEDEDLELMVLRAHEVRGSSCDVPTVKEIKIGLETQAEYDDAFRAESRNAAGNTRHASFTYNEIKQMIDRFCLSVDDEGVIYYVFGASTKPYFYTDKAGKVHFRDPPVDHILADNPDYRSRNMRWDLNDKYYYRYRYYDKTSGQYVYRDPNIDEFYAQGFVFVYETATGAIFSDYQNRGWQ